MEANELARKIVSILEDNKAEDIVLIDVSKQTDITDYFVIANGTSDRMIDALNTGAKADPKETLGIVHSSVDKFVGIAEQFDDLTMMIVDRK